MVVWIFAIATIALLVVMIQLMLLYQRRFNEIRIRQDPVRRRIENHYSEIENGYTRIDDAVVSGQEEIGLAIDHLHKQRDALTQAMSQLQVQADSVAPPSESEGDEGMLEVAVASEPDPHALLRKAQSRYEQIEVSIRELEKDATNVRRNMERIEVKMRRKSSAELQEAAKDEGEHEHEDGE
ncbi:MAG: hypothetical protein QGH25_00190 [Candidatus Latescibacteria bacterium]|jgi:hypothetical protein|nr:hypothetical protein [Candidatus Latescibacterota bacterium]